MKTNKTELILDQIVQDQQSREVRLTDEFNMYYEALEQKILNLDEVS